ncbi:hypothetical protein ARMSODRAFT_951822 [Armillaria solidipes]|uniref:Uncharacterized protein n=1 Tax=Armillaria solidipes TaxID=1076256 RepID=A0A2H3BTR0_9AGAR|nr:hypothetical protein ARMSODRAFT_951822 [Armillaria solidipes]
MPSGRRSSFKFRTLTDALQVQPQPQQPSIHPFSFVQSCSEPQTEVQSLHEFLLADIAAPTYTTPYLKKTAKSFPHQDRAPLLSNTGHSSMVRS